MAGNTPFSGANDLSTQYGTLDGAAAGEFRNTVPGNFGKIKSEILGLHGRLCQLETTSGASAGAVLVDAAMNSFFQVRRAAPNFFSLNVPSNTSFFYQRSPFVSPYTGGRLDAGAGQTYDYVQSIFPGWMMPRQLFSDLGQEPGSGTKSGARIQFDLSATYANDTQPGTGPYAVPSGGDMPGFYQIITRHIPIELLQGRSLRISVEYDHAAAIPANTTFAIYISYVDGGNRVDAQSPALQAGSNVIVGLSTADDPAAFPSGVIPATATSVEVGLMMTSNTAGAGTDDWDILRFNVDVGGARSIYTPRPYALDWLDCGMFYAQMLGIDQTGLDRASIKTHPILQRVIANGGSAPTLADDVLFDEKIPWPLQIPWKKGDPLLVPDSRVIEVIGANAAGGAGLSILDTTLDSVTLVVVNLSTVIGTEPFDAQGLTTHLQRQLIVAPTNNASDLFLACDLPALQWRGEIQCALAPLLY